MARRNGLWNTILYIGSLNIHLFGSYSSVLVACSLVKPAHSRHFPHSKTVKLHTSTAWQLGAPSHGGDTQGPSSSFLGRTFTGYYHKIPRKVVAARICRRFSFAWFCLTVPWIFYNPSSMANNPWRNYGLMMENPTWNANVCKCIFLFKTGSFQPACCEMTPEVVTYATLTSTPKTWALGWLNKNLELQF